MLIPQMRQGLMKSLSITPDNITRDRATGSWSLQNLMMDGWDDSDVVTTAYTYYE